MAERMVKFRLVTYFDLMPNQVTPAGDDVLIERTASMGAVVNFRDADEQRLDSLGALYTAEEEKAINDGTYRGADRDVLTRFLNDVKPTNAIQAVEGEGPQLDHLDSEQLGAWIRENRPTVSDTVALAGDDEDSINRVWDAENYATDNNPRKGVTDALDAKLAAAASK